MKTELFDFPLPEELIAQTPAPERSSSRLLIHRRALNQTVHGHFRDLLDLIPPGDLLVVNSSKVLPARLFTKEDTGRNPAEIFFIRRLENTLFEAMVRPGRRFKVGRSFQIAPDRTVTVEGICESGTRLLKLSGDEDCLSLFNRLGEMPLPPYITSREASPDRYQTIFSRETGSIAAPTAGLHFDEPLLSGLRKNGVNITEVVLHVGLGTFKPVEVPDIEQHVMHSESFFISPELAQAFLKTRQAGGKVWACGTTSVRTLESAIQADGTLRTGWGETAIFIKPGYQFKAVDHLITNFHLPRSTLIMLVSAFSDRKTILNLYAKAVAERYRFFSFGDAMVLL